MQAVPRLGTAAPVLLAVTLVAGLGSACEDEAPAGTAPAPTASETTAADCDRIVPATAITVLGWSGDGAATYSLRGCERRAAQGYVQVRELAVPGGGDDETAVQEEFDSRCAELDTSPDPGSTTEEPATGMVVTWLGDDVTACAVEPDADLGLSKVLLRTPSGGLAELWVAALETTDQALVREAMAELAEAAAAEL